VPKSRVEGAKSVGSPVEIRGVESSGVRWMMRKLRLGSGAEGWRQPVRVPRIGYGSNETAVGRFEMEEKKLWAGIRGSDRPGSSGNLGLGQGSVELETPQYGIQL